MDFTFTLEEESFRREIREFVKMELPEDWLGGGLDEEYSENGWPLTMAIANKLGDKGWLAMGWPDEYGGQAATLMKQLVYQEEMAYWGVPGTDGGIGGVAWIGPSLMLFGTRSQKQDHLPYIVSGQRFWCTAYSEPGAGSDLASLQCRAHLQGKKYIIRGQKIWTSAGHIADWCWLAANTNPSLSRHKGISLFLVDMKSPGITVRPLVDMSGLHVLNEIFFDDVAVPQENLVGKENEGWYYMVAALDYERVWPGIKFVFRSKRILDEVVKYIRSSARQVSIMTRQRLADIAIEAEAGRLMSYRLAWMQSRGLKPGHEASAVKVFVSELMQRVANAGMQVIGLYGTAGDTNKGCKKLKEWLQRTYLSSVCETILAGTSEIQRNIVAARGLGLPR